MRRTGKLIRNWKVLKDNLDFNLAYNLFKKQKVDGIDYPIIGLRLGSTQFFQSGYHNIEDGRFAPWEAASSSWEIIIPDDVAEEKTNKLRQMLKDDHFTGLRYEKIDNMSIEDIWNEVMNILNRLDKDTKYRLLKHIIENKLYKKV